MQTESRFRARAHLERIMRDARVARGRDLACLNDRDALRILTLTLPTCDNGLTFDYMRVNFVNSVVVDSNFTLVIREVGQSRPVFI